MKKFAIGCVIVLFLLCGGGAFWAVKLRRPAPEVVPTYKVQRGDLSVDVTESGAIEPIRVVEIKSKASGRLAELAVEEGDVVRQGALLAHIDPREVKQQVEQGEAETEAAGARTQQAMINIALQRKEIQSQLTQAQLRVEQLKRERDIQPILTASNLRTARSNYENAKKSFDRLVDVTQPQQRIELDNTLREAQAELNEAKRNHDRMVNLQSKGYVSQQQVDSAYTRMTSAESRYQTMLERKQRLDEQQRLDRESAQTTLDSAEAELKRAEANRVQDDLKQKELQSAQAALEAAKARLREIDMRELDLRQARASERQARSSLANLNIQLSETDVRSPIDGVVTKRYREVGELVMSAVSGFGEGTPIIQIADLKRMRVRLSLNELDVSKVRPRMPVEIKVDAFKNKTYHGEVYRIAPASQSQTGNTGQSGSGGGMGDVGVVKYTVEIHLTSTDQQVKPGMTARCRIIIQERKNTLKLPLEAIGEEKGKYYVLKVEPGKKTEEGKPVTTKVPVTIGLRGTNEWELLSGVREGTEVQKAPYTGPPRRGFNIEMGAGNEERREERREER